MKGSVIMAYVINDRVTWVGKIDWELNKFHGDEYSTFRGSSYNSYLIRDEKTVLIDTVWKPHAKEFVEKLKKEINLKEIDYIIANHGEIDHSGALPELMREIPDTPIYCTKNAVRSIKGHYHEDWNFVEVKTGDTLDIGKNKLIFIEARMLHWPDTMMTYMTGDNILFSNDAFGQHYASELMYNDLVDNAAIIILVFFQKSRVLYSFTESIYELANISTITNTITVPSKKPDCPSKNSAVPLTKLLLILSCSNSDIAPIPKKNTKKSTKLMVLDFTYPNL
jgi:flavorubredoxin